MAAFESMDFLQFETDSDRQETFNKMLAATGASIPTNTTTSSFDPSLYQKSEFDFFTSETSTLPASFFSLEDAQYAGYPLYPFATDVPRTAFPFYNEESTVFVQPPTLPSNYVSTDIYRGPTSPSVASSVAEGFDFTSGQSSTASGASTSSSDHGSPYIAPQEWTGNVEKMSSWTSVAWEKPELKETCVNPSLINNASRQSSVEAPSVIPSSPQHTRKHSTFRVSPYPTPSATSKGHRRSPSQFSSDEYFPHTPAMSREASAAKSAPSPERSTSSSGATNNDNYCSACGKVFRDLKAHQITHMDERPEKCPIPTCEYAKKGFARKYDCQRHTLTHYKGTMVCGFCPGSGLPSEKTFNRADVFKRHLMSVHNVEQTAPNGRPKKVNGRNSLPSSGSPRAPAFQTSYKDVTGKCSTCNATFANAQQFYEHLDDCVLSKVVKPEPEGEINSANLDSVSGLEEVQETLAGHGLLNADEVEGDYAELSEEDDEESDEDDDNTDPSFGAKKSKKSRKSINGTGVIGRTSKNGVVLGANSKVTKKGMMAASGRKRRRNLPSGWGVQPDRMVTKRRCLQVYDGSKLLCRDEMMMSSAWEVKANLAGGEAEVSDLDYWTVIRANAFHDAAKEDREAQKEQ